MNRDRAADIRFNATADLAAGNLESFNRRFSMCRNILGEFNVSALLLDVQLEPLSH